MVLSRRFLRVAALAAVFALGLAGTALAAHYVWRGTGGNLAEGDWKTPSCWDLNSNFPGTAHNDTVEIPEGSVVTVGDANFPNNAVDKITFKGGAKLLYNDETYYFRTQALEVEAGEVNIVVKKDERFAVHDTATNVVIKVGANAVLTLEGKKIAGGAGALRLTGAGKLVLKAPVTTVTDLEITEGGTLVADVDNALPLTSALTIDNGSIVVNGTGFGATSTEMTLSKGNLTLNKPMRDTLNKVTMGDGTLTVADGVKIGKNAPLDGEVDLKAAGQLVLDGNLTLKELTTAGGSKIDIASGKALTVKAADDLSLNAEVTGNLNLELADTKKATLKKDVNGKVEVVAPDNGTVTLEAEGDVKAVAFTTAEVAHTATSVTLKLAANKKIKETLDFAKANAFHLKLLGGNEIDKLSFESTLNVDSGGALPSKNTIDFLAPAADATLKVTNTGSLSIVDGTKVNWKAELLPVGTRLEVKGKDLLAGEVVVDIKGGALTLPSGEFPKLILKADDTGSLIAVNVATQDPVLYAKKVTLAANDLVMTRPTTWWKSLAAGDEVKLLEMEDSSALGAHTIKGNPDDDAAAKIDWKGGAKALVLTAKGDLKVPELVAKVTASGNKRIVNVTVSNDVDVNAASWRAELLSVVAPGSVTSVTLQPGPTAKAASFKVEVGAGFTSGTLRVYAKNQAAPNFEGFVDIDLNAVSGGGGSGGGGGTGGGSDKPSIDPASWAMVPNSGAEGEVTLQATLKLAGTPKSLDVEASGMEKPKAELLDAAGKVVATSSVPTVSATARTYKLRLTCKVTKAEIDAGAEIKTVTVMMADGTKHKIDVNKKLKDMNGGGNGGGGGGGKGPDGEKKGSSGGGCDAGVGGLALALGAAFLLKRRA